MDPAFVHLKLHSEYSLIDGLIKVKKLIERSVQMSMPAIAVTDHSNLFALIKFFRAATSAGIKPIAGCEFTLLGEPDSQTGTELTLLVMDQTGYRNLTRLVSKAWLEGQRQGKPTIQHEWLPEYSEGLIALSGGRGGDVGKALLAGRLDEAKRLLHGWVQLFPQRYYLELQRSGRVDEEEYLHAAVSLAADCDCPVVATNDVRFLDAGDFEAHEARVCIYEGRTLDDPRRPRHYSRLQYLRAPAEMEKLFADVPEALANSVEIARRCNLRLELGNVFLPEYPVPEQDTIESYFRREAKKGLELRLVELTRRRGECSEAQRQTYHQRLENELKIILEMGYPGYFLIVMDFVRWSKQNGVPVGPGRGSGAGSLVAYALGIIDIDPLEHELLFERFLNPERVSMPDFDIDFCMEGRDRVIAYVAETYGQEAVSQIITFGTMAAKAVVRDVARIQGKPYGLADKLAKLIPFEVGMTLAKAVEQEQELRDFVAENDEAAEIMEMAFKLEGVARNVGKHAGGVVIAPTALTDFVPLYQDHAGGGIVTQFDKDDVESAGLVKFDFLGLRTLTIIDWAVQIINREREVKGQEALLINELPMEDQPVFSLLQSGETTAIFQLESRGMKELIRRLKPSRFEDIVAILALFRPGPLQSGMVDDFIDRKHGRSPVTYLHPALEPILKNTYGVILYQEQVMQIAQSLAGYTLGGADLLRRAMGKKKPEEMAMQREVFLSGASNHGITEKIAGAIFDLMEKFAGYGFNKSHTAAYALVSYQTAWLKSHYPAQFMAAVLSSEMHNTDKVVELVEECRSMRLPLVLPDVNLSEYRFSVDDQQRIIYGLGAIKGIGEGPVESIVSERQRGGRFVDLFDFCRRVDARRVNRRVLEALIRSGALDDLGPERGVLSAALDEALQAAEQQARNEDIGIGDLFGDVVPAASRADPYADFSKVPVWGQRDRLRGEKETLGLYVTGHPIDEYESELEQIVPKRIGSLHADAETQRVAGVVMGFRTMRSRRGDDIAFVQLDDRTGRIEVSLFAEVLKACREHLTKETVLIVKGVVSQDDFSGGLKMRADEAITLFEARQRLLRRVRIRLSAADLQNGAIAGLEKFLLENQNGCPVLINYCGAQANADISLGENWRVVPSDEVLHRMRERFGTQHVNLDYR